MLHYCKIVFIFIHCNFSNSFSPESLYSNFFRNIILKKSFIFTVPLLFFRFIGKNMYITHFSVKISTGAKQFDKSQLDPYSHCRIEDLITLHYWSCLSELCMTFVFADCIMISTNQIEYFKCSAVFLKMTKSFSSTFNCIKVTIDWSI